MGSRCSQIAIRVLVCLMSVPGADEMVMAAASQETATRYLHDVWTTEHGLPQNSVTALLQTRDGYLWVGTFGGRARFDGVRFTVFTTANTKGLKSNRIRALYEDRAGNLWVGTENGGVTRFSQGRWTTYTMKEHLPDDSVFSIFEDDSGTVWLATTKGLARYQAGAFTAVTSWAGLSLGGLMRCYRDRQGTVWLGFWDSRLVSLRDGAYTVHRPLVLELNDWATAIIETRDGSLWVGTKRGLTQFHAGEVIRHTTHEGLSSNAVESLLEDRAGNLWVGTEGGGLKWTQSFQSSADFPVCGWYGSSAGWKACVTWRVYQPHDP